MFGKQNLFSSSSVLFLDILNNLFSINHPQPLNISVRSALSATPLPPGNPNIPGALLRMSWNKIPSFLIRMRNFLSYSITRLVMRDRTFSIHLHQNDRRAKEGATLSKSSTYQVSPSHSEG